MYINRSNNIIKNLSMQSSDENAYQIEYTGQYDITGTSVNYTPATGSSKVVYEYWLQVNNDPSYWGIVNFIELFRDQNDGNGFVGMGSGFRINEICYRPFGHKLYEGKFTIDSWSGSNSFKLRTSTSHAYYRSNFHEDNHDKTRNPIIIMYSIT